MNEPPDTQAGDAELSDSRHADSRLSDSRHASSGHADSRHAGTRHTDTQMEALGDFIRRQRKLANLSLRQLAERTRLSNPYLSQIERGLHQPSMRVIKVISEALNVSAETLLTHAGLLRRADAEPDSGSPETPSVERAIDADPRLSDQQKSALISVYRSMLRVD
jgi:transcriptional regulator with XRE-family HTH domain